MPDTTVKFGLDQLSNPTPIKLKIFFRVFSFISGLSAIILAMLPHVPEHMKYMIVTAFAIANTSIQYFIKFFGLQNTGIEQ